MRDGATALCLAVMIAGGAFPAVVSWAGEPHDQLRRHVDDAVKILDDPGLKGAAHVRERRAAIRAVTDRALDTAGMAKRSLGRYWAPRTPEEQQEFIRLLGEYLQRSYEPRLDSYDGEKITYSGERIDGASAVVQALVTSVSTTGQSHTPMEFRMMRTADGSWRIYDVLTDGVSLVENYRAQFIAVVQRGSYEELIKKMRAIVGTAP